MEKWAKQKVRNCNGKPVTLTSFCYVLLCARERITKLGSAHKDALSATSVSQEWQLLVLLLPHPLLQLQQSPQICVPAQLVNTPIYGISLES